MLKRIAIAALRGKSCFSSLNIPANKSLVPTYSESARNLDSEEIDGQILFKPKEHYSPRALNAANAEAFLKKKERKKTDIIKEMGIDPIKEYKNVRMLSHFVTEMGFIKPRGETGLSLKNQKRVAKAIRRSRAMGLMPYTYKLK